MERRLVNANKETTMNDAPRTEAMLTRIQGFVSGRVDDKALVSVKAILVVASGLCADLERELAEQKQARKELADELEDWRTATGRDTHLEVFDLLGRLRSRISDLSREVIELTAKQGHARDSFQGATFTAEDAKFGVFEGHCNKDPRAPHGFDRQASHSADRYVCDCESWNPPQPGGTSQ
jgi:hypothetical protein